MSGESKRVNLELPETAHTRLQELKIKTEAASLAEVVKNALKLYAWAIEESQAGGRFLVEQKNGRIKEYALF